MNKQFIVLGIILLTIACMLPVQATVYYVTPTGGGTYDGSSWSNAFDDIADGLAAASSDDEVWVKEGTYTENINLVDGVCLYGGFSGTGTTRDPDTYVTTINGGGSGSVATASSGVDTDTIIDGFTITNGSATYGAGILCNVSSPTISNNIITSNTGTSGGAIFICYGSPIISNNTIYNNTASAGSSIYGQYASPVIFSNLFYENTDNTYNGTVHLYGSSATIVNNTIADNSNVGLKVCSNSFYIANNIIVNNGSWGINAVSSICNLLNNCVYGNTSSNYYGLSAGPKDIQSDPSFVDDDNDDYHISMYSPCIDAGDDTIIFGSTDIDGGVRNVSAATDIGADEFGVVYYVSDSGDDSDGLTWNTAFDTVTEALTASSGGDDIWVEADTYYENITLAAAVGLYGGFDGTESYRSERDWETNTTTINGGGSGVVVTSPSGAGTATRIDGFTITNGSAANGAGIYSNNSSPTITNNIITGNTATNQGGGIKCSDSSAVITGNEIYGNSATDHGGGIYCYDDSPIITKNIIHGNSSGNNGGGIYTIGTILATITNNEIYGNSADYGSAIGSYSATQSISSNLIYENTDSENYIGTLNLYNSNSTIVNNTITDNYGVGMMLGAGTPGACTYYVYNNIVTNGTKGIFASGSPNVYADYNCVYGNSMSNYNGLSAGENDISSDPLFVDDDSDDYHLSVYSPCAETGDNEEVTDTYDLDGSLRIAGLYVDMGAYEHADVIEELTFSPDEGSYSTSQSVTITCPTSGVSIYYTTNGSEPTEYSTLYSSPVSVSSSITLKARAFKTDYIPSPIKSADYDIDDTTPPSDVTVTDEGNYTPYTTQLYASWTASTDAESGIAEYQYAIGTTSCGTDVVDWTTNGTNLSVTHYNLNLIDGYTYYISVKAKNGEGLWSNVCSSDGITVDTQLPTVEVYYVTPTGAGSKDGSDWDNAFDNIANALTAASASEEIWVKEGTYTENITLKTGVALYGGFDGTESYRSERDWETNTTTINGGGSGVVVTSPSGAGTATRIDGFTITNGSAANGAGIYSNNSSPTIANNIITGNTATNQGGGIKCSDSSAVITGNEIYGNSATDDGGGIYCYDDSPIITNNIIHGNTASDGGGGVYIAGCSPTISNNEIYGNTAVSGSGIKSYSCTPLISGNLIYENTDSENYYGALQLYNSNSTIVNNTITDNYGVGILMGAGTPGACTYYVYNNIVTNGTKGVFASGSPNVYADYNCVYGNSMSDYYGLSAGENDISSDPLFVDDDNDDYHLSSSSPCIEAGNDDEVIDYYDIDAGVRIVNTAVDMGSDEFGVVYYVSDSGDDSDGLSWDTAFDTITEALTAASGGDDIWVAADTYTERITLTAAVGLYGGFNGTEIARSERDWINNETIIDGDAGGTVVTAPSGSGSATIIDGFTITDGSNTNGGGMLCSNSSCTVSNNKITGNTASGVGGAIYAATGSPTIKNNTIYDNTAAAGSGIYGQTSTLVISGNLFYENTDNTYNGTVHLYGSPATVANNTIVDNSCAGLYVSTNTFDIYNNIIAYNGGWGINAVSSTCNIGNNCVYGNTWTAYNGCSAGTGDIQSDPLFVNRTNDDYDIEYESPCIESGDDEEVVDDYDIEYGDRIVGQYVDMGAYEYNYAVDDLTFTPGGGSYGTAQSVTITCPTEDVSIYYTTDTSTPTEASALYSGPVTVNISLTLKARAYKTDYVPSAISSEEYTIDDVIPPVPGTASSPIRTSSSPFSVTYTGASDTGGSGLDHVELWYKKEVSGTWTDTTLTSATASGSFNFTPSDGYGIYYFDLVAEDGDGNRSAAAAGNGDCSTVYESGDTYGHAMVYTEYLYPGGPAIRVTTYAEDSSVVREATYTYGPEEELLTRSQGTQSITYTYDALYRVKTLADAKSQTTSYTYDDAGNLIKAETPGGDTTEYTEFTPGGRILERVDGNDVTTSYEYKDPCGLMTKIDYPSGTDIEFEYDEYGRVDKMTDGAGYIEYSYDDLDNTTETSRTFTGLSAKTVSYSFNLDGSLSGITVPGSNTFSYTYDAEGRLTGLTNPYSETTSWTYEDNNWISEQEIRNSSSGLVATTYYSYNDRGKLTELINKDYQDSVLSSFGSGDTLEYDTAGNMTVLPAVITGSSLLSGDTDYTYDSLGQLTLEDSTRNDDYTLSFAYDAAGNPTTFRGVSKTYNSNNQNTSWTYDSNGNPTTYKSTTLTYDYEDRLTAYGSALTMGYTGNDLRAWKDAGSGKTYFIYAVGRPVCELDSSGDVIAINTFGVNGLISRHTSSGTVFYTFDPQGNVVQELDSSSSVTQTNVYDSYGDRLTASSDAPFGFGAQHGYYTDSETGLILLTQRYYDPDEGRFLTRDPIGYLGGMNLYAYVNGNPVNYVDPLGLRGQSNQLWYDRLSNWTTEKANIAKKYYNENLPWWQHAGYVNTCIDVVSSIGHIPSSIGHLGEATGTFSAEPTLENFAGVCGDVATFTGVVLIPVSMFSSSANVAAESVPRYNNSTNLGKQFTPQQQALQALVKERVNTSGGLTCEEAELIMGWADEYGLYARGPEFHLNGKYGTCDHIHVNGVSGGKFEHIMILDN